MPENKDSPNSPSHSIIKRVRRIGLLLTLAITSTLFIGWVYWQSGSLYTDQAIANIEALAAQDFSQSSPNLPKSTFDLSNSIIPKRDILSGGPPKDGIPAILEPTFITADEAAYLHDSDLIIGMQYNGVSKAYPHRIIVWHEIVNDTIGDLPIVVTYCPLCGTSMVFDRRINEIEHTFGVSGLLYNSDVLMYDHQTESLWSQLMMQAVSGTKVEAPLTWLTSEEMTWAAWRERHPETLVLSTETGYIRNYQDTAYKSYKESTEVMFPVPRNRNDLPQRDWVLGITINNLAKAYSIKVLEKRGSTPLNDHIGNLDISITYDSKADWPTVKRKDTGETIPHVRVYWFAWQAFYPETLLYTL